MTCQDIAALTRTARKAGLQNLLQLSIAGELLRRGEATLVSMAVGLNVTLEAIAHACAEMERNHAAKHIICREALGYTIARLTPTAEALFREFLSTSSAEPLRAKNSAYETRSPRRSSFPISIMAPRGRHPGHGNPQPPQPARPRNQMVRRAILRRPRRAPQA